MYAWLAKVVETCKSLLEPGKEITLQLQSRSYRERERELNSVHAANRADGTQWIVHVRVSSILSSVSYQALQAYEHMRHACATSTPSRDE